jgi:hypothetical protein
MKKTVIIGALAILTISSTALAFSKNLSGTWNTSKGAKVKIIHNPDTSVAKFSFATTSGSDIEFKGIVRGDNGSSEFAYDGYGEDVAFRSGDEICSRTGLSIGLRGQVIGIGPKRSLEMAGCLIVYRLACKDKEGDETYGRTVLNDDCKGTWK